MTIRVRAVSSRELRKRYGADYQVIGAGSADDPPGLLARLRDDRRVVSIVLAGQRVPGMTGTQLLARVREFHGTTKRLLLIDGGYGPPPESILQAIALGHVDAYARVPATVPDEEFHLAVTELLQEWARSNLPRPEVMRVVGEEWSARSHEIRDLLSRNVIPFGFYPAGGGRGKALLEQAGAAAAALPVIIMLDGRMLENPSNAQIAGAIGMRTSPGDGLYDVAVIGAGPGLAAAVYGASEGLSTVVLEPEAIGGQAGTSSRIRNYLGFPAGVSGENLALRAYTQAWNFGVDYVYGNPATGLRSPRPRARGDGRRRGRGPEPGRDHRHRRVLPAAGYPLTGRADRRWRVLRRRCFRGQGDEGPRSVRGGRCELRGTGRGPPRQVRRSGDGAGPGPVAGRGHV